MHTRTKTFRKPTRPGKGPAFLISGTENDSFLLRSFHDAMLDPVKHCVSVKVNARARADVSRKSKKSQAKVSKVRNY